ncbi:MAG: chloride channel protein [Lactococcus raffinolactis]|uniref:ClC family H(+)/Cl(-) exchange transporter n=1 Tax=Pseudolactococcus raffinolactis TaxID=1366 RepID=UPI003996503A
MYQSKNITNNFKEALSIHDRQIALLIKSLSIGIGTGIIVSLYRYVITFTEEWNLKIYEKLHNHTLFILIGIILVTILALICGLLVKCYPMISGSGIPQVKAIVIGYFEDNWFTTLLNKFIVGTLSIGIGLSLGREGPSIQMGASVADGFGKKFSKTRNERRILIAAGAGAGLAAAFGAPLAGVLFVLEEIFRYLSSTMLLATCIAALSADYTAKLFFGMSPVFNFPIINSLPLIWYWLLPILGILTGLFGVIYNKLLMYTTTLMKSKFKKYPIFRPVPIFIITIFIGLYFPSALGGGHNMMPILNMQTGATILIVLLLVKFLFSVLSFSSGVAGGIFFPLLMLGACIGAIFGHEMISIFNINSDLFYNFMIFSMAGVFSSIVRAPITGIVLLTEMTGSFTHLLPLSIVVIFAFITANFLNSDPIYDSLLDNLVDGKGTTENNLLSGKKVMFEQIVHFESQIINKSLENIAIPAQALIVAIRRNNNDIIPNGKTRIHANDVLMIVCDTQNEVFTKKELSKLTNSFD